MTKRTAEDFFWKYLRRFEAHFVFWKAVCLVGCVAFGLAGIAIGAVGMAGWSNLDEGLSPALLLVLALALFLQYTAIRAIEGAAKILKQAGVARPPARDGSGSKQESFGADS